MSGRTIVFRVRRAIYVLDAGASNPRAIPVALAASPPIGLSIAGRRIAWLEASPRGSRVRAVALQR